MSSFPVSVLCSTLVFCGGVATASAQEGPYFVTYTHYLEEPGNVEIALGLTKCQTQPSWEILGNVGNLSSATILFILQEWLEKRPLNPGEYALAAAFGPGFSAEFLLLQWT